MSPLIGGRQGPGPRLRHYWGLTPEPAPLRPARLAATPRPHSAARWLSPMGHTQPSTQQRGQRSAGTNPAPPGGHSGFWLLLYLFLLSLLLSFAARNTNQIKIFCVTVMCLCDTPIFRSVPPSPSPPHQLSVPPRRSLGSHPDLESLGWRGRGNRFMDFKFNKMSS